MGGLGLLRNLFAGLQLAFSDGVLTLDAGSGDEAQASESIEAQIEGEDITTGFNPQFLLDGLTAIDEAVEKAHAKAMAYLPPPRGSV